jgi:hypothetical protein
LIARDELAAQSWRVKVSGPPPSETILLLDTPRALSAGERSSLLNAIDRVAGPREVPEDTHLIWRTNEPEVLDTTATSRGGAPQAPSWPQQVRAAIDGISGVKYTGRTFRVVPAR